VSCANMYMIISVRLCYAYMYVRMYACTCQVSYQCMGEHVRTYLPVKSLISG
jgi:hypothetical protein